MSANANLISFADAWSRRSHKLDIDLETCTDLVSEAGAYFEHEGQKAQTLMSPETSCAYGCMAIRVTHTLMYCTRWFLQQKDIRRNPDAGPLLTNLYIRSSILENDWFNEMPDAMKSILLRTDAMRRHVACLATISKAG